VLAETQLELSRLTRLLAAVQDEHRILADTHSVRGGG
jgi:hypothetical protein